jgi:CRP-like cAMP-binding protein
MTTTPATGYSGVESRLSKTASPESPFVTFAKNVHPLSLPAEQYLTQKTFSSYISKGSFLVTAGNYCPTVFFIKKGILRSYVKEGIKEITTWITTENELVTSITSFGLRQPARENIQALEDCELIGLQYEDLQYLYDHFPEMNIVGRKILEGYYRDAEERAFIARLTEATTKYKHFIATKSDLLNRVPLKFIASYLGMTLETLSRIRSKLSRI